MSSGQAGPIVCVSLAGLAAVVLLAPGTASCAGAARGERAPQTPVASPTPKPTPKPKFKITTRPHLVAVGPMGVDVTPVAGPRVRRPPLLPTPKPVEPEPEATPAPSQPQGAAMPKPAEPSDFSPDAPITLLPGEKTTAGPAPVKKDEPRESVLAPAARAEAELKDAVMYFETPVGPHGSRASIPMAVPQLTSPATVPQPESRANYRKEKE